MYVCFNSEFILWFWYDWLARKVGWNNLRFVTYNMWRLHLDKCYLANRTWKGERIIRIFHCMNWTKPLKIRYKWCCIQHFKMFIGVNVSLDHYSLIHDATNGEYILSRLLLFLFFITSKEWNMKITVQKRSKNLLYKSPNLPEFMSRSIFTFNCCFQPL